MGQYDGGFRAGYGTYYYTDGRSFVGGLAGGRRKGLSMQAHMPET